MVVSVSGVPGYSGPLTPGRLAIPNDLAVDGSGNLYVTDSACGCVQQYSAVGELLAQWAVSTSADHSDRLGGMALDRDNVYAVDVGGKRVVKLSARTGELVAQWQTEQPSGLALDPQGSVVVAEGDRISKFTAAGQLISRWASDSGRPLTWAQYLAIDATGNIYVSEGHWPGANGIGGYVASILKLSPDGDLLAKWGGWGIATGQFEDPKGITVDRDGNIYVADQGNNRIQQLTRAGKATFLLGGPGDGPIRLRPQSVELDAAGNLYVLDASNHQILKWTRRAG